MKDIDKELSTILRKVVLFDEEDKLETELIENIKELFKESVPAETLVMPKTCELKLPMTITLKKDELDRGYYDGRTNHNGKADFLYSYCKKKKIPLEEPKNKEGRYDRYIIKLETPEQALNLLLWDKFEALSKLSG